MDVKNLVQPCFLDVKFVHLRPGVLKVGEVDFRTDFQLLRPVIQLRDHFRDSLVRHRSVKVELLKVEFKPYGKFSNLIISRAYSALSRHDFTSPLQRQNVLNESALRRIVNLIQHHDLKHDDFNLGLVDLPHRPMVYLLQLAVEINEPFQRRQTYLPSVPASAFGILSSFSNTRLSIHFAASL